MNDGEKVVWAIAGILIAMSPVGYVVGWMLWAAIGLYIIYVFMREPVVKAVRFIASAPGDFVIICKWLKWLWNGKKL